MAQANQQQQQKKEQGMNFNITSQFIQKHKMDPSAKCQMQKCENFRIKQEKIFKNYNKIKFLDLTL